MTKLGNLKIGISVFICLAIAACGANDTEKVEKLLTEADGIITEAEIITGSTERKNRELFAAYIETDEALQDYKQKMNVKATNIIEDFEKAADLMQAASDRFSEAAKLRIPIKFKEYLEIKAEEFAKRAEVLESRKRNAQAFLEENAAEMVRKFEENNNKSEKLSAEAVELGAQADRIRRENKNMFFAETHF